MLVPTRIWFEFDYLRVAEPGEKIEWQRTRFAPKPCGVRKGVYPDEVPTTARDARAALERIAQDWVEGTRFRLVKMTEHVSVDTCHIVAPGRKAA